MKTTWIRPTAGVLLAIGITTSMDVAGLTSFSALPLFPLMLIFWYLERLPRQRMGFVWGQWKHYGLAILYPVVVLGLVALVSAAAGVVDLSHTNWEKTWLSLVLGAIATFLVVILTEEGFFRGWLWASLEKAGLNRDRVLVVSSIAFSLWHLSWVTLTTDGKLPIIQLPVFIANAAVIGAIWGLLRRISGSVIVASLSHGLWNGIAYAFFGFGAQVGALGIKDAAIYGPEVGVLGLILNVIFAVMLWRWVARAKNAP